MHLLTFSKTLYKGEIMTENNKQYTSQTVVMEEETSFAISRPGVRGTALPSSDVPKAQNAGVEKFLRKKKAKLPEISEPEAVRHFSRLSTWNTSIDFGIYPLGSCTMKHNPRLNEEVARSEEIAYAHPYDPIEWTQAHLAMMYDLQNDLANITGMPGVCLQPSAGAQGELTGLLLIAEYHRSKGRSRPKILTADTSHGTNPASAAIAGFKTVQIKTGEDGVLHPEAVAEVLDDDVAGLMLTNPNTLGIFEKHIDKIAEMLHEKDALLYIDGANMNAVMGISRPGDYGADVIQFNLHKTFSTPHGGGGPGSGPIAVSSRLWPFLPEPLVVKNGDKYDVELAYEHHIGRVKAFYGNFGMFARAWCYIRTLGEQGIRQVSRDAILNANYLRYQLADCFNLPVDAPTLHEVVFNDKDTRKDGLSTSALAKQMLDFGIHPPTVHFPLLVKNAIMIEPTETESRAELDRLVSVIKEIVERNSSTENPVKVFREKIDEVKAARQLVLCYEFPEES